MTDVYFINQVGSRLAGRLELPGGGQGPFPVVLFAHGFDSGKDSPRGLPVAKRLREAGIATLLFDFTGHGDSEGTRADSTPGRQVDDLTAAMDFVDGAPALDSKRLGICGASSGGLVALAVALSDGRPKTLVLRGPRTDNLMVEATRFTVPILIIQGGLDPLLPDSLVFYKALNCEKDLKVVAGADHLFSEPDHLRQVIDWTTSWFVERLVEN